MNTEKWQKRGGQRLETERDNSKEKFETVMLKRRNHETGRKKKT